MKKQFELVSSKRMHDGFLKVDSHRIKHESYRGGWCPEIVRERLEGLRAVSTLLYDPERDRVVMVEQFRVGTMDTLDQPWILETIGGYRAEQEVAEDVARRESMEEANMALLELEHVGDFYVSPGVSSEQISLYCAKVDSSNAGGIYGLDHEGEEIKVVVLSLDEAINELFKRINSTSALITVQWLAANRERLKSKWSAE